MAERRNGEPQTHPKPNEVERLEQAHKAVELKNQDGWTFVMVGEALKCSASTAHKLYKLGLKEMAPVEVKTELAVIWNQLEHLYYEMKDDLAHTNDPLERVKLYSAMMENLRDRRRMLGQPDINILHINVDDLKEQVGDLYMDIEADQDIRNAARARTRRAARG